MSHPCVERSFHNVPGDEPAGSEFGFGLVEFLISATILLITASLAFGVLSDIERTVSYQTEVQSVLNNSRLAIATVGRYIRQAGNDPEGSGLIGITIISSTELRIKSDLTGSEGPGNPDKGDPDGDTNDSNEDVTIRYNAANRSLEIVPGSGPSQVVAGYLSGLSFRYYDAAGQPAAAGKDVCRVNVTISGASLSPDPQSRQIFGLRLSSDFQVAPERKG